MPTGEIRRNDKQNFSTGGFVGAGMNPAQDITTLLQSLIKIAPLISKLGAGGSAGPATAMGQKIGGQVGQNMGMAMPEAMAAPDPVTDAVQKQVIKQTKAQVDEAMQNGVPAEQILATQQQRAPMLSRILGGAGSYLEGTMGRIRDYGLAAQGIETPNYIYNKQTAQNMAPPSQSDMLRNQTVLIASMLRNKGKLSEEEKGTKTGMSFGQQVVDVLDQYDALKAEGKAGPIGANFFKGVTAGSDEDIHEFDSMAGALVYSAAKALADQQGRGISDADIKRMEKIFKVSATSRENTLTGKLNAGIKLVNSKYGLTLPSVEEIRNLRKKAQRSGGEAGSVSREDAIAELKRRGRI